MNLPLTGHKLTSFQIQTRQNHNQPQHCTKPQQNPHHNTGTKPKKNSNHLAGNFTRRKSSKAKPFGGIEPGGLVHSMSRMDCRPAKANAVRFPAHGSCAPRARSQHPFAYPCIMHFPLQQYIV